MRDLPPTGLGQRAGDHPRQHELRGILYGKHGPQVHLLSPSVANRQVATPLHFAFVLLSCAPTLPTVPHTRPLSSLPTKASRLPASPSYANPRTRLNVIDLVLFG